ncbi:MAG: exo-alpha-sialidase [Bacteroidota bacterium]
MKSIWLLLLFGFTLSAASQSYQIPEPVAPGNGGLISGELIYSLDNKPTPECHASTIVEVPGGILAAWFAGTHERNADVGIWSSRYESGRWSVPVKIIDGVQQDSVRYPCWNPVLFRPINGPLILFYKVGPSPSEWWGMRMTSSDDGITWSAPEKLGTHPAVGDLIGPVKNKPVQLNDGTILCPSSREEEINEKDRWRVHFESSRDGGRSWEVIGPINDGIEFNAIQPSILFHSGGRLQILCRTQEGRIGESWSSDGGRTWSRLSATKLPNPNAGTDAVTLKDGRQLLVYNHTVNQRKFPSGRNMLNISVSNDGRNWKPVMTLERSKGEYSYPAVIQSSDGLVHITYTYLRQSIRHVVIDPAVLH